MRLAGWSGIGVILGVLGTGGWVGAGCASSAPEASLDPGSGAGAGDEISQGAAPGAGSTVAPPVAPPGGGAALSEGQVIGAAAQISGGVIEASELAAVAGRGAVQAYAVRMVDEQMVAMNRLQLVSRRIATDPTDSVLSRLVEQETETTELMLLGRTSADFDDAYADSQVEMHTATVSRLDQQLIPSTVSQELRDELLLWRTAATRHLAEAQALPRAGRGVHPPAETP